MRTTSELPGINLSVTELINDVTLQEDVPTFKMVQKFLLQKNIVQPNLFFFRKANNCIGILKACGHNITVLRVPQNRKRLPKPEFMMKEAILLNLA
jgi:hypothetical protein